MAEAAPEFEFELDVSHLVTEDDTPVDNPFQDKQMRLLTEPLYSSWKPQFDFVAMSDVGLYYSINEKALVPDVLVSTHVRLPAELMKKRNRSYFVWEYGKVPDLVIEIVSNKEGGELTTRREGYLQRHIPFYVVFDPALYLGKQQLRCFEYSPSGYVEMLQPFFSLLELGLTLWKGSYEGHETTWLRWCDADRGLLPTGNEASLAERARGDQEKARADQIAEQNAQLLERLRAAGLEP